MNRRGLILATGALAASGGAMAAPDAGTGAGKAPGVGLVELRRRRHLARRVRAFGDLNAGDVPRSGHRRRAEHAAAQGDRTRLWPGLPRLRGGLQAARWTPRRLQALHGGLSRLRLRLREGLGLSYGPRPMSKVPLLTVSVLAPPDPNVPLKVPFIRLASTEDTTTEPDDPAKFER